MAVGDAQVEYNQAVTDARTAAEHAVTEDRVPRRYHDGIRDYFQQLPDEVSDVAEDGNSAGRSGAWTGVLRVG